MNTSSTSEFDSLEKCFRYILEYGSDLKNDRWCCDNILMRLIGWYLPQVIVSSISSIDFNSYVVKGGSGSSGKWAHIPYVCILDTSISMCGGKVSPSVGVYPAYLISSDCKRIYLTYISSVGSKSDHELKSVVEYMQSVIHSNLFFKDSTNIHLGNDKKRYSCAIILYKEYDLENMPSNDQLIFDLEHIIDIHKKYKRKYTEYLSELWKK